MKFQMTRKSGFTLIELIIVIAILGIMALFGTPALKKAYNDFKLRGEVRDIYSALQNAKLVAIRENASVVIQFAPQAYAPAGGVGSYYIFVDNGEGAGGGAGNGTRDGSEEILSNVTMPSGISLMPSDTSPAFTTTNFDGRGLPGPLGSVRIRNTDVWYKISINTAGISMKMSKDGTTWL